MAVTQQRIIDIIDAGLDFKQALDDLIQLIDQAHDREPDNPAVASLWALSDYGKRLRQPHRSAFILAKEREHFRANRKRNIRNAAAAERKRRREGAAIMPREGQFEPLGSIEPRLARRVAEGPDYSSVSPERRREIIEMANKAKLRDDLPADWTPDDPEDSFNLGDIIDREQKDSSTDSHQPGITAEDRVEPSIPNDDDVHGGVDEDSSVD